MPAYKAAAEKLQVGAHMRDERKQESIGCLLAAPPGLGRAFWQIFCRNTSPWRFFPLQGIVPFVAVDCDREANRPLCSRFGIQASFRPRALPRLAAAAARGPLLSCGCTGIATLIATYCCSGGLQRYSCPSLPRPLQGFPTIKLFAPGSAAPTDYQGPREAKALANAAVGAQPRFVEQLGSVGLS